VTRSPIPNLLAAIGEQRVRDLVSKRITHPGCGAVRVVLDNQLALSYGHDPSVADVAPPDHSQPEVFRKGERIKRRACPAGVHGFQNNGLGEFRHDLDWISLTGQLKNGRI